MFQIGDKQQNFLVFYWLYKLRRSRISTKSPTWLADNLEGNFDGAASPLSGP